jgi:hypothetical protein
MSLRQNQGQSFGKRNDAKFGDFFASPAPITPHSSAQAALQITFYWKKSLSTIQPIKSISKPFPTAAQQRIYSSYPLFSSQIKN